MQILTIFFSEPKHKHTDIAKLFYTFFGVCMSVCVCLCTGALWKHYRNCHEEVRSSTLACLQLTVQGANADMRVSHRLVTRPGCVSPNLILAVSCCDVHFNCRTTAKALTTWAWLGSGGSSTSGQLWVIEEGHPWELGQDWGWLKKQQLSKGNNSREKAEKNCPDKVTSLKTPSLGTRTKSCNLQWNSAVFQMATS